jgi:SHS2 domain-containing protein
VAHSFDEHTSETRLSLSAPSLEALLEEAALAMMELVVAEPLPDGGALSHRQVALESPDRDALLVDWLNEIIFLTETGHACVETARVSVAGSTTLTAEVGLRVQERLRNPVKAASFHDLSIVEEPGEAGGSRFRATIILDV